jgi:hypothetical protein
MIILEEELKAIIKKYKLTHDEMYRHSEALVLVSARGIRKIITTEKLNVSKRVELDGDGGVIVTARVEKGGALSEHYSFYEALGEAKPGLNTNFKYPVAVAEARANSRAVLMSLGLYEKGVIGEMELDIETEAVEMIERRKLQVDKATFSLTEKLKSKKP